MNRYISGLIFLISPMFLTGCAGVKRRINGPDVSSLVLAGNDLDALHQRIQCDRKASIGDVGGSPLGCTVGDTQIPFPRTISKVERNNVQSLLLTAADRRYDITKNHLINGLNSLTFAAEMSAITLSSVSAIIGDTETKTILSTASALTQSTNTAIKKDFFANMTSSALINQMDADRAKVMQVIVANQSKETSEYSFESALKDAVAYDNAASPVSASQELGASASAVKTAEEQKLQVQRTE